VGPSSATSATAWPRPHGEAPGGGAVRVSVLVPATVAEIWVALTERDVVGRWFGDLSETLRPGGTHRLDFGDGDFFAITDVTLDPPHRAAYRWRFLGTSPSDAISWSVERERAGCRVTVTDTEPSRTAAGCDEMVEGWTDFLQRLQDHCITGQNTRYAWRSEFGGSIELPLAPGRAWERLFPAESQGLWMPWSGAAIASGAAVTMRDQQQPARLTIRTVEKTGASVLRFTLTCPQWRAATECRFDIQPWPSGALLVVTHTGWPDIDARDSEQAAQRARFGTLWTNGLRAARDLLTR
jgi:uncharacterized protein YndB with AHSA1/START domain